MERTICDRCGRVVEGAKSIVGLWGPGGRAGALPSMSLLPAVCVMNLCPACRKEIEAVLTPDGKGA